MNYRVALLLTFAASILGCAPRLKPLGGELAPVTMPRTEMPRGYHQIFFDWEYSDQDMTGKGNGVARVAYPDSARLDFFLAGGFDEFLPALMSMLVGAIPAAVCSWLSSERLTAARAQ